MNTTEVAAHLGTSPRILRQFLRSAQSTFVAVGSGSRYEFTDEELPTLERRFQEWSGNGTKAATRKRPKVTTVPRSRKGDDRAARDEAVWAEEGPLNLPDIRDPRVRAAVRAEADAQERRLEVMMMRAGLHISQVGWDRHRRRG